MLAEFRRRKPRGSQRTLRSTRSDRKSWTLDDKLGELLQELELRSVEDDHRDAEERRKAGEVGGHRPPPPEVHDRAYDGVRLSASRPICTIVQNKLAGTSLDG